MRRAPCEPGLGDSQTFQLAIAGMDRVVVPRPDSRFVESATRDELERIADDEFRIADAEKREVLLDALVAPVAEVEAVDADEPVAVVTQHRRDQARSVIHADLDVALFGPETGRGEVEEGEVVLQCEVRDLLDNRSEAPVDGMLGMREFPEERREIVEKALGVHGVSPWVRSRALHALCATLGT